MKSKKSLCCFLPQSILKNKNKNKKQKTGKVLGFLSICAVNNIFWSQNKTTDSTLLG